MASKIRSNDEVVVLTGKDRGKRGRVTKVLQTKRVFVENINLVKKHQKPVPALGVSGGILEQEASLHISNVSLFNPTTHKADKVGFRFENGKKVRFFKSTGETIK